jgi:hypothetical protein
MFKLIANPTFPAKVGIPVAGGSPVNVVFIFKHRTKTQYAEWLDSLGKRKGTSGDLDTFLDMVDGWIEDDAEAKKFDAEGLSETFNRENAGMLLEQRMGVAQSTFDTYLGELTKAREKN